MAATVTILDKTVMGNKRVTTADVVFDSSYPTGGESVTPAQLGLSAVHVANATISVPDDAIGTTAAKYVVSTGKIMVYDDDDTPAEVASTADLAGLTVRLQAFGH